MVSLAKVLQEGAVRGVVATGDSQVTAAAAEMLRGGGNAYDAAVAAGFAAAVAEPALTSLGGGGFLLARTADRREILFDFFVDTPGRGRKGGVPEPHFVPVTIRFPNADQLFHVGLGAVAVPGTLKGLLHVHRRLGRVPLEDVLRPAIELARRGAILNEGQAEFMNILLPILTLMEEARDLYTPGGRPITGGMRLANPDLARFLETLPGDGEREFYAGGIARRVVEEMATGDGLLTREDLAAYEVVERKPLAADYRGHRLLSTPPPMVGGSLIAAELELLAGRDLPALGWGSTEHLRTLVMTMREIERLRGEGHVSLGGLDADGRRQAIDRLRPSAGGTTHISVTDCEGNVASMTTSNGEGSGYIAPGTGIMLNNMLGEEDLHPDGFHGLPPGQRVPSMMAPSVLLRRGDDGRDDVRLVLGSGGSNRILTAILQVVSSVVDFGLPLREAVEAPRIHWDGERVQVEPGYGEEAIDALRGLWPVNEWSHRNLYFGGVHAVDPPAGFAGDPRRSGSGAVVA